MKYRKDQKTGEELSILGYGCMRFTKKGTAIDQEKAEEELLYALKNGVNYFDTAYIYPGVEVALGKFMAKGYRPEMKVATKLPHYLMKSLEDIEKCFAEQLRRLQTDYIDYYLIHMLTDLKSWERLCALGIEDWILKKKESGAIRRIGFSFHGGTESFCEIVDAYPWEFCQIQFNYMDEHSQAGLKGLRYAHQKGLPVIIMEPLRGGRLVNGLPARAKEAFAAYPEDRSPAEWGLRWIWNHPEVTVVLSGMNDIEQVKENIRIASSAEANAMSEEELSVIFKARDALNAVNKVGCTGCRYCMPCPSGVDIPTCFRCYNVKYADGWLNGMREYFMNTTIRKVCTNASLCKKCGKCEAHCPQGIEIRKELDKVKKEMENPIYKIAAWGVKKFGKF